MNARHALPARFWSQLQVFLQMIRFSHTLFALPFALLAAAMAWRVPLPGTGGQMTFRWQDLLGIVVCMVTARSAAMTFNRLVDRDLDAENPRTRERHLVTGQLSSTSAWRFWLAHSLLFVGGTAIFWPNALPLLLALPVLLFVCAYSYTKRFTVLAHFWLGTALMLAPVCAWVAIRGQVIPAHPSDLLPPLVVGGAVLLWVAGFDVIYACQDVAFDRTRGLHSIPAAIGIARALRLAAACHAGMVLLLAAFPWICPQVPLGPLYGLAIVALALLLVYEHALVRPDDLQRINVAFFRVNAVISLGLAAVVTLDIYT